MAKVITFSRTFPSYHPRAGEETNFVEKFHWGLWSSLGKQYSSASQMIEELNKRLPADLVQDFIDSLDDDTDFRDIEKHHTVRIGHRFKSGEYFSPRVWSGVPYNSKQIIIGPDILIPKTWDFKTRSGGYEVSNFFHDGETEGDHELLEKIAANDGLTKSDFVAWFNGFQPVLDGQIICWNEKIEY